MKNTKEDHEILETISGQLGTLPGSMDRKSLSGK